MAGHLSSAVAGTNFGSARSFAFAFNAAGGATVEKDIAPGSYYVVALTGAALVKVIKSGGTAVAALATTQPAGSSANGTLYVPTDSPQPLDVPDGGSSTMQLSALGYGAAAGTLVVIGPIRPSTNG